MCDVWGRKISSNVNTTSDNYVRRTGDTIVGELSMNGNNINDLPTDVSKLVGSACACSYGIVTNLVSSTDACVVHKAGDTMTGNLMLSVASDNLRTFGCIDLSASKAFSIFLGSSTEQIQCQLGQPITMLTNNGFLIKCNNNTVARCGVSSRDNRLWIYQDIIMNQHFIANVKDPRTAQDAATKNYTDTRDNLRILKAGDTMSGVLNMNNNKITNIPVPSSSGDATNKAYVDAKATNNVGLIGILTGASANKNGFVVTSSGDFSSNYAAWKIWDVRGSPIRAEWATPGILANYWVMIQSVAALTVHKFHIAGRYKDSCQPSSWRIEGSNDGINFTVLHTSTVTLTSSVMEFQFNPAPNVEYNYFKFYATASSLTTGNPGLSYFMLF